MSLSFYLRQAVKWPGIPFKEDVRANLSMPPTLRGRELFKKYALECWAAKLSRTTLDEILGVLDLLDRIPLDLSNGLVLQAAGSCLRGLDVGAKNWSYLGALAAWFNHRVPNTSLDMTGVEVDAFRLYSNLRTRLSYARYFSTFFTSRLHQFKYQAGDVRGFYGQVHWITWLFPFVTLDPHLSWGLPRRLFDPANTFQHVESSLQPGGLLIMANQGQWEWEAAKQQIQKLRLAYFQVIEGSLNASAYPIFLTAWMRDA